MPSRFHVVSSDNDNELYEIRHNRLKIGYELAGARDEFQVVLDDYDKQNAERETMDLISHSAGVEAYLELGDWRVDDVATVFLKKQKQLLLDLKVKNFRLVGCHTAASSEGWDAIKHIANAFGNKIVVWGTKAAVYAKNFSTAGYDDSSIVGSNDMNYAPSNKYRLPLEGRVTSTIIDFDAHTQFPSSESPFSTPTIVVPTIVGRALLDAITSPVGYELPGLLAKPIVTVMARVGVRFVRIDFLLAFSCLRIFTAGRPHGLIYEARRGLVRNTLRSHLRL